MKKKALTAAVDAFLDSYGGWIYASALDPAIEAAIKAYAAAPANAAAAALRSAPLPHQAAAGLESGQPSGMSQANGVRLLTAKS